MARPTKFIPEIKEAILTAIGIGATYKDASEAAGVDYDTFKLWMDKGRNSKSGEFFTFFVSVRQKEADARLKYLQVIQQAAQKGEWKAALEYLKRRDRVTWGDSVDLTTQGEKIVNVIEIVKTYKDDPPV